MVSVNDVTVAFSGNDLFKNISFLVNEGDRVGLVGKNGAGKSTLLKIITSEISPSSGTVSKNNDTTVGYLAQQMKICDDTTLFQETAKAYHEVIAVEKELEHVTHQIGAREDYESEEYLKLITHMQELSDRLHIMDAQNRDANIEKTLQGLGFKRSDFERLTREFSGGWRMRIELAKILLRKPDVMLLDEPTNHLDIESIQWLESYLKDYRGAIVLISHDRKFLDTITNRTIEIILGRANDYKVPYSKYLVLRDERRAQQIAAYENQQKLIAETERFIERFRYKPSKSNQVQSRVKQLEKLEVIEIDDEDNSSLSMRFAPAPRSGQIVLEVKEAGKSFDEKHIFSGAEFTIERGEKIAFVGRNGEGKTTFARMVLGQTETTRGTIKVGHNVKIGYFAQNQDDLMDGEFTVFDTLDRVAVGDIRTRLRDILGAFLFKGEDVDKKVKVLSGGERSRLAMARLMLEPYNMLILDEPTNHMDIRSKDILKKALKAYDGTLVVISHDREFLDGLTDKIYEFRDGVVKEHLYGIYEFLEKKKMESLDELHLPTKGMEQEIVKESVTTVETSKLSYEERKNIEKQLRKLRNNVTQIEKECETLELEIAQWDEKLANPAEHDIDINNHKIFDDYNALKQKLEDKMNDWELAHLELEEAESNMKL
ncbi:MAG: ABC-F family ATP-binding cassette domain-containing protein [Rikenellaceae bacterium]